MKFKRYKTKRMTVDSSTISAIEYYDKIKKELVIEFKGGSQYLYKEVPEETFEAMKKAESKGIYFHANIKNKFETVKIKGGEK